jgi:hypothetical protein
MKIDAEDQGPRMGQSKSTKPYLKNTKTKIKRIWDVAQGGRANTRPEFKP